jgi:hypothetical protein
MTLAMPSYLTAVDTAGVAVLPVTWSDKLRQRLAAMPADRLSLRVLREAYEGLPMRVAQGIAGEQVLSSAGLGAAPGWHRQRVDSVADGAPSRFVPGLCIAGPVGAAATTLWYVPGSASAPRDAPVLESLALAAELVPGDVAVLDSRCMRRWSDPAAVFRMSVVRTWIQPERDGRELITGDVSPQLARFAGSPWAPAETVRQWLFERHERRSG